MKSHNYLAWLFAISLFSVSCSSLKTSRYAAYNSFTYAKEQPRFNFENDSLRIEGAWHWASGARAMPKMSFMPKVPKQIVHRVAKRSGQVLFATYAPQRTKYSVEGYVPVTRKDVRFKHRHVRPLYIIVLVNDQPFKIDTVKYKPQGRNQDDQFELYASDPQPAKDSFWIMEVVAAGKNRYYDFVCILDNGYTEANADWHASLFLEDVKRRFVTL